MLWLRPSRFIEVTGEGLNKLSEIFEFASRELKDVTPLQMENISLHHSERQ